MNGVLAVSALAVFAAVCGALIKKGNPEIALLFSIGAAVLVFLYVLPQTESLAETIGMLAEASEMSEALQVLLKALGRESAGTQGKARWRPAWSSRSRPRCCSRRCRCCRACSPLYRKF